MCRRVSMMSLATVLTLALGAVTPLSAAVRLSRVEPQPACLGQELSVIGSFGTMPGKVTVQIRPNAPSDNRILVRWNRSEIDWSAKRIKVSLAANAVPPGRYRLIVQSPGEFDALRSVQIASCAKIMPMTKVLKPRATTGGAAPEVKEEVKKAPPTALKEVPRAQAPTGKTSGQLPAVQTQLPAVQKQLPAVQSPTATPGVGGGTPSPSTPRGSVPTPEMIEEVRQAGAGIGSQPRIDSLAGADPCVRKGTDYWFTFDLVGRNFGATQGSRTVAAGTLTRHTFVGELQVVSWSDTRIRVRTRDGSTLSNDHAVGLRDAAGRWISNFRTFHVCADQHSIAGNIDLRNCGAGMGDIQVRLNGEGLRRTLPMLPVPGNDFAMRYEANNLPAGTYTLQPELLHISCPGGSWEPATASIQLTDMRRHAVQDFNFGVPLDTSVFSNRIMAAAIQSVFRGTQIHLNNYGPRHGDSWYLPNDSYLQLPEAMGGGRRILPVEEIVSSPRRYYVNDINLSNIRVRAEPPAFVVTLNFETDGAEIKGHCVNDIGCLPGTYPDVQADISVDVYLTLTRWFDRSGQPVGLSFGDVRVVPRIEAQAGGICEVVDFICTAIQDYRRILHDVIVARLTPEIDSDVVRDQVYEGVRPTLTSLGVGQVVSVRMDSTNVTIQHLPVAP